MSKDKLTKKDIYNRLCEGKDFEIEHLWQRSVFLGAFLVLFFTIYFTVLCSVFSQANDASMSQSMISADSTMRGTTLIISEKEESEDLDIKEFLRNNTGTNIALLVIALLGASFSFLWIFMAKGSKFWYEKYEKSIDEMQKDEDLFDESINKEKRVEEAKAKLEHREVHHIPIHGHMPSKEIIDSVFSHKGGAYSLSNINVSIGHIFSMFWFLVCAFHEYLLLSFVFSEWSREVGCIVLLAIILFVLLSLLLLLLLLPLLLLLLLVGNCSKSSEADWSNVFRVFWSIRELRKMWRFKFCSRKRNEISNIAELIDDSDFELISKGIQSDEISSKDKKWQKVRKYLENKETRECFLSYCEEKIFSTMMPSALCGDWTEKTRGKLTFAKNSVVDEGSFLQKVLDYYSTGAINSKKYKIFTSIPWELLKNKYDDKKSLQDGLNEAFNWQIYCILCDDIDNMICYERFDFNQKGDKVCLESVLVNYDGEKLKKYIWYKK